MDSEERRFSGKVYTRRNRKTQKKDVSPATVAGVTAPETTKVSETLDSEQPAKVVPQTDLLITNSTSGDVPQGGVELKEGSCGGEVGENRVTISLSESRSRGEIRNVGRRLESELDDVRRLVKKIETKQEGFALNRNRKELFKSCNDLLEMLRNHGYGWVFNEPVDVKALGLYDYHDIIKRPMDLGTIKTRLSKEGYNTPGEFAEDIRLVFHNAKTYNPKGHYVHVMAEELLQIFEERWAAIEAKYNPWLRYQMHPDARILERSKSITGAADPMKKKPSNKRNMTSEETRKLARDLEKLPREELGAVAEILKKRGVTLKQNNEEVELDIDSVDAETLWELDWFVKNYNKSKAEVAVQARARASQNTWG